MNESNKHLFKLDAKGYLMFGSFYLKYTNYGKPVYTVTNQGLWLPSMSTN